MTRPNESEWFVKLLNHSTSGKRGETRAKEHEAVLLLIANEDGPLCKLVLERILKEYDWIASSWLDSESDNSVSQLDSTQYRNNRKLTKRQLWLTGAIDLYRRLAEHCKDKKNNDDCHMFTTRAILSEKIISKLYFDTTSIGKENNYLIFRFISKSMTCEHRSIKEEMLKLLRLRLENIEIKEFRYVSWLESLILNDEAPDEVVELLAKARARAGGAKLAKEDSRRRQEANK